MAAPEVRALILPILQMDTLDISRLAGLLAGNTMPNPTGHTERPESWDRGS